MEINSKGVVLTGREIHNCLIGFFAIAMLLFCAAVVAAWDLERRLDALDKGVEEAAQAVNKTKNYPQKL